MRIFFPVLLDFDPPKGRRTLWSCTELLLIHMQNISSLIPLLYLMDVLVLLLVLLLKHPAYVLQLFGSLNVTVNNMGQ